MWDEANWTNVDFYFEPYSLSENNLDLEHLQWPRLFLLFDILPSKTLKTFTQLPSFLPVPVLFKKTTKLSTSAKPPWLQYSPQHGSHGSALSLSHAGNHHCSRCHFTDFRRQKVWTFYCWIGFAFPTVGWLEVLEIKLHALFLFGWQENWEN